MPRQLSFDDAWSSYINGSTDISEQDWLLRRCVKAATTIDELTRVFQATFNAPGSDGVRSPALKKMLEFVQTADEAKAVYVLAGARNRYGFIFPAREKEAKAKLQSLATT